MCLEKVATSRRTLKCLFFLVLAQIAVFLGCTVLTHAPITRTASPPTVGTTRGARGFAMPRVKVEHNPEKKQSRVSTDLSEHVTRVTQKMVTISATITRLSKWGESHAPIGQNDNPPAQKDNPPAQKVNPPSQRNRKVKHSQKLLDLNNQQHDRRKSKPQGYIEIPKQKSKTKLLNNTRDHAALSAGPGSTDDVILSLSYHNTTTFSFKSDHPAVVVHSSDSVAMASRREDIENKNMSSLIHTQWANRKATKYKGVVGKNRSADTELGQFDKRMEWNTSNQTSNLDTFLESSLNSKLQNDTTFIYANYSLSNPRTFALNYDTFKYFITLPDSNTSCYVHGTDFGSSIHRPHVKCVCNYYWHGAKCSIPEIVHQSISYKHSPHHITVRTIPKRVINALIFNAEWELLEARICGLYESVDVFLILESNYSMYGNAKPLRLLERLKQGYLHEYQDKIVHVFLDHFPDGGRADGWIEDRYLRNFLGKQSLKQLTGYHSDDLFLYTDADELPSEDAILFLKLHDGYSHPIGLSLRWSVFGFFWKNYKTTTVLAACSMALLRDVLQGNIYDLRSGEYEYKYKEALKRVTKDNSTTLAEWYIGEGVLYAGWHCSWCLSPDRIANKLFSAINGDFPRWGDFPEKLQLSYISKLIKTGVWFDDVTNFGAPVSNSTDAYFAPPFVINHWLRYEHILDIEKAGNP